MTLDQRQMAIDMLIGTINASNVAWHLGVHRSTISSLQARHQQTGHVADRRRSGSARKTSPCEDNYIIPLSRLNSSKIGSHVRNTTGKRISFRTIRNCLRSADLRVYLSCDSIPRTLGQSQARLQWAKAHRRLTINQ